MALNDDAAAATPGGPGYLALTNHDLYSGRTVWFTERRIADAFELSFSFEMHGGSGGDGFGFAWVEETDTTAEGDLGGSLGILGLTGYAVEFDMWPNG